MRSRAAVWALLLLFGIGVGAIALVGRGPSGEAALPALPVAGPASAATASMVGRDALVAPGTVEYRVAGDLPEPASSAPAYRLGADTAEEVVAGLAAALGLRGDVEATPAEWAVYDGSAGLHVARQPGLPWWYASVDGSRCAGPDTVVASDGPAPSACPDGVVAAEQAERAERAEAVAAAASSAPSRPGDTASCEMPPCPEGQACIQVCPDGSPVVEPPRPADLPTEDEAARIARRLLADLGLDAASLRVDDGFDRWFVTAEHRVGGLPVLGFESGVVVGRQGRVESANGHLGTPEHLGDYPLAGVGAGLERLRAGGVFGGGPGGDARMALAPDGPVECPPEASCVPSAPARPIVRTVTGVSLALLATGEHLVPAYVFAVDDGAGEPVVAVAGAHLTPLDAGRTDRGAAPAEPAEVPAGG